MNVGLKDTFEFHVQKCLTGVDGYTPVWQRIGPSIDAFAVLVLVHAEEGSGFSLQDVVGEAVELGLITEGRTTEVVDLLRQEGLLDGSEEAPEVGETARFLMAGLDAAYPKMPGIVLPAFLVQILQELMDGRNDLDKALNQVDQTLMDRGADDDDSPHREDPAEAEARRERFLKRIASIRKRLTEEKGKALNVQEVTPQAAKGSLRTLVVSSDDPPPRGAEPAEEPKAPEPEVPKPSQEEIQREAFLAIQREKMELERQKNELLLEKKRLEEERQRKGAAELEGADEEKKTVEHMTHGETDEDIAAAIARFEESLSLVCPICKVGKLETRSTEHGKTFYRCDNRSCGFVTWKRPYPFACPVCKNPFLVENDAGDGLACPRSVCSFKQEGLEAPQEKAAAPAGTRRVRKVRRVVRKKR
ncbi:hypothetical protein [Desulfoluna butyratoxydans]|uniref:Uncharacterized protein n=1 Tax=Desulfoluna butyratoxydans TaxID=231438 RepID=A0A4U8YTB2_9BACT|nr:hypothetical protein [Desulfoluna butyratoxydans]VFQ47181.1 hypothetical protein MSL71_48670 [Desulfoluna butyratoxydans]